MSIRYFYKIIPYYILGTFSKSFDGIKSLLQLISILKSTTFVERESNQCTSLSPHSEILKGSNWEPLFDFGRNTIKDIPELAS